MLRIRDRSELLAVSSGKSALPGMTKPPTPRSMACSTNSSSRVLPTLSTARSGTSGRVSRLSKHSRPSTSSYFGFTGYTRPGYRETSSSSTMSLPATFGTVDAPTSATDSGASILRRRCSVCSSAMAVLSFDASSFDPFLGLVVDPTEVIHLGMNGCFGCVWVAGRDRIE